MADLDGRTDDGDEMLVTAVRPPTSLAVEQHINKQLMQSEEKRICDIKAQAAVRDSAAQVELDNLRARLPLAYFELEAKIKSAKEAMIQAQDEYKLYVVERDERQSLVVRAIETVEEERQKARSEADAAIQQSEKLLDKLRQREMAP